MQRKQGRRQLLDQQVSALLAATVINLALTPVLAQNPLYSCPASGCANPPDPAITLAECGNCEANGQPFACDSNCFAYLAGDSPTNVLTAAVCNRVDPLSNLKAYVGDPIYIRINASDSDFCQFTGGICDDPTSADGGRIIWDIGTLEPTCQECKMFVTSDGHPETGTSSGRLWLVADKPGSYTVSADVDNLACIFLEGSEYLEETFTVVLYDLDLKHRSGDLPLCAGGDDAAEFSVKHRRPVVFSLEDNEEGYELEYLPRESEATTQYPNCPAPLLETGTLSYTEATYPVRIKPGPNTSNAESNGVVRLVATDCQYEVITGSMDIPVGCACAGGQCTAGSENAAAGSVSFSIDLGKRDSDGHPAGKLAIIGDVINDRMATPDGLSFMSYDSTAVKRIPTDILKPIQQAEAPEVIVDVQTVSPTEYRIDVYLRNGEESWNPNIGTVGLWEFANVPLIIRYNVKLVSGELIITKSVDTGSGLAEDRKYTYSHPQVDPLEETLLELTVDSTVVREELVEHTYDVGGDLLTRTRSITQDGGVVSIVKEEYTTFSWGPTVTKRIIDPAGLNRAIEYDYYDYADSGGPDYDANLVEFSYRPKTVVDADGNWTWYIYRTVEDSPGVFLDVVDEIRPWLDTAKPVSAPAFDDTGVRSTSHFYDSSDRIERIEEHTDGGATGRTEYEYLVDGGQLKVTEHRCLDAACNASSRLTTVTLYVDATDERISQITHADGRITKYEYLGSQFLSGADASGEFSGPPSGDAWNTEYYGQIGGPYTARIVTHLPSGGAPIANETTRDVTITDSLGRTRLTIKEVSEGGATWTRTAYNANNRDDLGRVFESQDAHREYRTVDYSNFECCGSYTEQRNASVFAVETDVFGRVTSRQRTGADSLPHPTNETVYSFDDINKLLVETTRIDPGGAGTIWTTGVRKTDRAGRLVSEIDANGLTSTYAYGTTVAGGRKVTVTRPDGGTEITEYYLDGQIKSETGTGVVAQYYDYGVNGTTTETWQRVETGSDGSPRYVETQSDWAGRTSRTIRPAFDGGTIVTENSYHAPNAMTNAGLLEKTETNHDDGLGQPGSVTQLIAPMLYAYNTAAEVVKSGLDVNDNGTLDASSNDRFTETEVSYIEDNNRWWRRVETKQYRTNGSDTDVATTVDETSITAVTTGTPLSETRSTDVNNDVTRVTRSRTGVSQEVHKTLYPDGSKTEEHYAYGYLVYTKPRSTISSSVTQWISYDYDDYGRRSSITDPRVGVAATTSYHDSPAVTGQVKIETDADGNQTEYAYYTSGAGAGQVRSIKNDLGKYVYYGYTQRGELDRAWGDVPQPMKVTFDTYGQRTELYTWRDEAPVWSGTAWPNPIGGDKTTLTYDAATGLLASKKDAANKSVVYDYEPGGRLKSRTWARGDVTTYSYDPDTGDLTGVDYDGSSPDEITFTYTRQGQIDTVDDNVSGVDFDYDYSDLGELTDEATTGTLYSRDIVRTFVTDAPGRLEQIKVMDGLTNQYQADYGYELISTIPTGRLQRVQGPGLPTTAPENGAWYGYVSKSDLIDTVTIKDGTTVRMRTTRAYEANRPLLTSVTNVWDPDGTNVTKSAYGYANDDIGRRQHVTNSGTAFAQAEYSRWLYNDRHELTGSHRHVGTDPASYLTDPIVDAQYHVYSYDPIGNRKSASVGSLLPAVVNYARNNLNQYTQLEAVGALPEFNNSYDDDGNLTGVALAGDCNCDGSVTVGDVSALQMAVDDPPLYESTYPNCDIVSADTNGDGVVDPDDLSHFLPHLGGTGSSRNYSWDAENRLTKVEPASPANGDVKVEFTYDYLGRRVRKVVTEWDDTLNGGAGDWKATANADIRFVWGGWLLLMELDGLNSNAVLRKYTWGQDLSGGYDDAGGIRGLLAMEDLDSSTTQTGGFVYTYDANGNVGQVLDVDTGSIEAHYEYGPYGQRVNTAASGEIEQPIRFSTKYFDGETSLYYYGYRYYSPEWGRWIKRDPLGEDGGANLQAMVANAPTFEVDSLGLCPRTLEVSSGRVPVYAVYVTDRIYVVRAHDGYPAVTRVLTPWRRGRYRIADLAASLRIKGRRTRGRCCEIVEPAVWDDGSFRLDPLWWWGTGLGIATSIGEATQYGNCSECVTGTAQYTVLIGGDFQYTAGASAGFGTGVSVGPNIGVSVSADDPFFGAIVLMDFEICTNGFKSVSVQIKDEYSGEVVFTSLTGPTTTWRSRFEAEVGEFERSVGRHPRR